MTKEKDMFEVYLYTVNNGDGSCSIGFYLDKTLDEDRLGHNYDYYSDGDGIGPKRCLTFESKEAAIAAGIPKDIGYFDYEEESE